MKYLTISHFTLCSNTSVLLYRYIIIYNIYIYIYIFFFSFFFFFSCFLSDTLVFFVTLLAPILAIILFNIILFVVVVTVLVRHFHGPNHRNKSDKRRRTSSLRLMVSIFSIMSLFGLSWIFAAFTVTVREIRLPSQVLFTVFSSFQGFGIFIFFCVTSREARESWKELLSCGKYRSEVLRPSKFTLRSYEHRVQAFGTLSSKAAGTLKSEAVPSNYTSKCNNVKSLTMTTMLSSNFSDTVQTSLLDCSSTFTESPVILTPVDIIPSPKDFEEMPTKVVGDDLFIQDPSQENGPVSDKTSATCEPEETTTTSSVDDSYILKPKITRTTTARSLHEIEEAKLDFVDADDSSNGEPVLID